MLLQEMLELIGKTVVRAFPKRHTRQRASRLFLLGVFTLGRRCITRQMATIGQTHVKPYPEYKVFSRSPWNTMDLFSAVRVECAAYMRDQYYFTALDETKVERSGKHIKDLRVMRDPMSPPFHVNFIFGLRFLQFSALSPLHEHYGDVGARGIPVAFQSAPSLKKPGKRASDEEKARYAKERQTHTVAANAVRALRSLRKAMDAEGLADKILVNAGDGAFCNRIVFRAHLERTILIARCRNDAALCYPAPTGSRRVYGTHTFRPKQIGQDERIEWKNALIFHGGAWRTVRYKELKNVLWRRGAGRKPVRLVVVAPTAYRTTKKGKLYYREWAYLICDSMSLPIKALVQCYFDRWQIEVNHRDEKQVIGVGQAQVRADQSVPRNPAFMVASYAMLLLAGLKAYGPYRTEDYLPLPAWRKPAKRPSCLDLVALLRQQAEDHPELLRPYSFAYSARQAVAAAYG